jgi:hypothetical protein
MITYTRQTKAKLGKSSCRIAELEMKKKLLQSSTISPETLHQADKPLFDTKKASKVGPDFNWYELLPIFSLDSCKLCHYAVKDVMYAPDGR